MHTRRLVVDPNNLTTLETHNAITLAAEILRAGGTVAVPTETVYGLGANALDESAVAKIFAAKQRPAWDPVIVHVADEAMVETLVIGISATARALMTAFWPGPLTLLMPRSAAVPGAVTAGRPLVGVRMPAHPVTLELIRRAGVPIAAPSANLFGHTSPTTAAHVLADLDGRIDAVLDAGPTAHGVESTVLDPALHPMVIYRPGAVTAEQIRAVAGQVEIYEADESVTAQPREALPSPGVSLRHYAPNAKIVLVEGDVPDLGAKIAVALKTLAPHRTGVLLPGGIDIPGTPAGTIVFNWGRWSAPEEMARCLYAGLRELDAQNCFAIVCPLPRGEGIGGAIRDRLLKAAASDR